MVLSFRQGDALLIQQWFGGSKIPPGNASPSGPTFGVCEYLCQLSPNILPGWLRIDPTFDPLRNNSRFRKPMEGTG
jgi:hypothetical protein